MRELVFVLEEASARALLEALLERLPLDARIRARFIVFDGKRELMSHLTDRLRRYPTPTGAVRFLILRDQDSHPDCRALKADLLARCHAAGRAGQSVVRLACRELETMYLADLAAVEAALGLRGLARQQLTRTFRNPDHLNSAKHELRRLTGTAYTQVAGSRAIGQHLDLTNTRSATFKNLLGGIRRLEQELLALPIA